MRHQSRVHFSVLRSNTDVHTVASLLKLYLRELPEPVIPFHKYDEFLTCAKLLGKDDEMVRKHLATVKPTFTFVPPSGVNKPFIELLWPRVFRPLQGLKELKQLVESLPPVNYNLLKYICRCLLLTVSFQLSPSWGHDSFIIFLLGRFLDEVQSYSGVNKMTVQNLATVFGPNILRPKVEDPVAIMEGERSCCILASPHCLRACCLDTAAIVHICVQA